jgi:membrane fusion protein (multidrug efflux system)
MMLHRKLFFPLLALSVLSSFAISGCKSKKDETLAKGGAKPRDLKAEGYLVSPEVFQNDYAATGTLLPNEEIDIHPEITGRITSINFREGTYVSKGQLLVQLNDADVRSTIQKLRSQRQLQVKMLERQEELLRIGGISRQDYETTETQIQSIDADIAFQQAELTKAKIVAPFSGIAGIRSVSVGAVVSPTSVIARLQQVDPLKVDFSIPEQYHGAIALGKVVFFSVDGKQEPYSGKISAVDPGADLATRTVKVRALIPNAKKELIPGAFAQIKLPMESEASALLVPSQAVIPTTREKKLAIVKNGKADLITVKLGIRTSDKVEVISGLAAGDTVILTGLMQVKPGMDVKITKMRGS